MADLTSKKPLLEVRNLKTYFFTEDGVVKAINLEPEGGSGENYPENFIHLAMNHFQPLTFFLWPLTFILPET